MINVVAAYFVLKTDRAVFTRDRMLAGHVTHSRTSDDGMQVRYRDASLEPSTPAQKQFGRSTIKDAKAVLRDDC